MNVKRVNLKMIRAVILSSFIIILGCENPKFDATTEQMIKISYNKVLQSIPEEKRRYFDELVILYVQPYEQGGHEEKNSIENLHGMNAKEMLKVIEKHADLIADLNRQEDIIKLQSLTILAIRHDSLFDLFQSMKLGHEPHHNGVIVKISVSADYQVKGFTLYTRVENKNNEADGKTIKKYVSIGGTENPLSNSNPINLIQEDFTLAFFNKNGRYKYISWLDDVVTTEGPLRFMTNEEKSEWELLSSRYPKEFSEMINKVDLRN